MSIRTICVQYIGGGSILELPATSENERVADALGIPCAKRALEHEVRKVVVFQPDERRQEFVPVGEGNKVLDVLLRHPELPIMLLTPNGDGEYDTYYHEGIEASVEHLLRASEVDKLYGDTFGLDYMKIYDDISDVAECIEDVWLWDNTYTGANAYCQDAYDVDAWIKVYRPIARMMAEDMPWKDYVIIRACL